MLNNSKYLIHGGESMNADRVKGTIDEVVGSTKRKVGEPTDDTHIQVEGAAQHVKCIAETA
jgi:uncharacterized protein YjbJ (UPF0337 family)